MGRMNELPFPRGFTWYNGSAIDTTNTDESGNLILGGFNIEGKEFLVEDTVYNTGFYLKLRAVRNTGSVNLLPGQLVHLDVTGKKYGAQAAGHAAVTAEKSYPVDELLGAAGCPPNDLCYVVVEGPAKCLTSATGPTANIAVGGVVFAQTASATATSLAGYIDLQPATQATTTINNDIQNIVGRAMSAATTGQTNTAVLVNVGMQ